MALVRDLFEIENQLERDYLDRFWSLVSNKFLIRFYDICILVIQ